MKTVPLEDHYTTLDCPDYGPVSVVKQIPLVSYKSYCETKDDNRSALISMIMECTSLKETAAGTFTERDYDHIGRHLAGSLAAGDVYDDARKSGKSPAEALAEVSKAMPYPSVEADRIKHITGHRFRIGEYARMGLVTPALWSNHKLLLNATAQAASLIPPIAPPAFALPRFGANLDVGAVTKIGQMDVSKALREQLTIGIPAMPDPSRQWKEYQKQVLAPAANAINGLMRDVMKPSTQGIAFDFGVPSGSPLLAQMDSYCKEMLIPLRQHLDGLSRLGPRLAQSMVKMNGILSMPKLQSSLKSDQDFADDFQATLKAVHQAITATNDFFSTPTMSISSLAGFREALQRPIGTEVARAEDIVPSVIRIVHDGDLRTYQSGALVIVKKTELLRTLKDGVEEVLDKKIMEPYMALLDRAESLSKPQGFLECLQAFAGCLSAHDCDVFWERKGQAFTCGGRSRLLLLFRACSGRQRKSA